MRIILVLINLIFGKEELAIEEKIMEDLIRKLKSTFFYSALKI